MATITKLIDDIDGSDAVETVEFALDGVTFEIDLSEGNAAELRGALAEYIEHGRRTGGRLKAGRPIVRHVQQQRPGPRASLAAQSQADQRAENRAAREWARTNGFPNVSSKGRIPDAVLVAFRNRDANPEVIEKENVGGKSEVVTESAGSQAKPRAARPRSTSPRSAAKTTAPRGTVQS
jgi:hypothetical protein